MKEKYFQREVRNEDIDTICSFPLNEDELFFFFPKAVYPLNYDQLMASVNSRSDSTVIVTADNVIAGFANFYEIEKENFCSVGNVIVNPLYRGKGVGEYLMQTMERKAATGYNVKELHVSCFNKNIAGLMLYTRLGFIPYEIEKRFDKNLSPVALIKLRKKIR